MKSKTNIEMGLLNESKQTLLRPDASITLYKDINKSRKKFSIKNNIICIFKLAIAFAI